MYEVSRDSSSFYQALLGLNKKYCVFFSFFLIHTRHTELENLDISQNPNFSK
ncbi:hypothetical protein H1P_20018 [Hyella patelloides LEGE 07179]|uniref:Uncharacterized protein n=1 Tax=Hyella patelloides LEGE 07179 TaxID=945734 RepID=A0A563VPT0_9CYAN|nr:hypothetical protein H1P_20018 [Hyella patelloides LEGE 07179]